MNILNIVEIVADSVLTIGTHKVIGDAAKAILPKAASKTDILLTKLGVGTIELLVDYSVCKTIHDFIEPQPSAKDIADIVVKVNEHIESSNEVMEKMAELEVENAKMTEAILKLSMTKEEYSDYMKQLIGGNA